MGAMTEKRLELDRRETEGVEVRLLWSAEDDSLTVAVSDARGRDSFELVVDRHEAVDVFNHPYAYAAFRGVDFSGPGSRDNVAYAAAA